MRTTQFLALKKLHYLRKFRQRLMWGISSLLHSIRTLWRDGGRVWYLDLVGSSHMGQRGPLLLNMIGYPDALSKHKNQE